MGAADLAGAGVPVGGPEGEPEGEDGAGAAVSADEVERGGAVGAGFGRA